MEQKMNGIGLLEFFAVFLILISYGSQGLPVMGAVVSTVGQFGIPLLSLIIGYSYFKNPSKENKRKIINKLLWLWLFWLLIYFPNAIYSGSLNVFFNPNPNLKAVLLGIINLIIYQGASCFYNGGWFLLSMAICLGIIEFCRRHKVMWVGLALVVIVYISGLLTSNYQMLFPNLMTKFRGFNITFGLFGTLIWCLISYYVVKYEKKLRDRIKTWHWIVLAMSLVFLEYSICRICKFNTSLPGLNNQYFVTLPFSVVIIFIYSLNRLNALSNYTEKFFKDISTLIFFVQFGVGDVLRVVYKINVPYLTYPYFLNYVVWTVAISLLVWCISKIPYMDSLRRLYR